MLRNNHEHFPQKVNEKNFPNDRKGKQQQHK